MILRAQRTGYHARVSRVTQVCQSKSALMFVICIELFCMYTETFFIYIGKRIFWKSYPHMKLTVHSVKSDGSDRRILMQRQASYITTGLAFLGESLFSPVDTRYNNSNSGYV